VSPRIHYFASRTALVDTLSERIATLARTCLEQRGAFRIVLAGGTTPRELYQRLRHLPTDWQRWHIYFGDERCLPVGHPDRNDTMAAAAWLDHVAIPAAQIHRVPSGVEVTTAAADYAAVLTHTPGFDLTLLGLGEDGHIASLFPGDLEALNSSQWAVAVSDAPKPPPQRVSMSAWCLSRADAVWFMVTGENKRHALQAWLAGVPLPPQGIEPRAGVDIFTDIALEHTGALSRDR
jgi:6-phosphogluconolactonase